MGCQPKAAGNRYQPWGQWRQPTEKTKHFWITSVWADGSATLRVPGNRALVLASILPDATQKPSAQSSENPRVGKAVWNLLFSTPPQWGSLLLVWGGLSLAFLDQLMISDWLLSRKESDASRPSTSWNGSSAHQRLFVLHLFYLDPRNQWDRATWVARWPSPPVTSPGAPSPVRAEQDWICQNRSRMVCRFSPSANFRGRGCCEQILLVNKDEHGHAT